MMINAPPVTIDLSNCPMVLVRAVAQLKWTYCKRLLHQHVARHAKGPVR